MQRTHMAPKWLAITTGVLVLMLGIIAHNDHYRGHTRPGTPITKEEALRQAAEFRATEICPQVVTPAKHLATGATYTFNNGCLPDGWKPDFSQPSSTPAPSR